MPTTAITRAAISVTQLMTPADVERESRAWSANCGPCALAAVLGVPVQRVRRLFPDFAQKPWVNPSTMWTALRLAGRAAVKCWGAWPTLGLAHVQWHGPWLAPGVPVGVAYRQTHWIGCAQTWEYGQVVYDVNGGVAGAWMTRDDWELCVVPMILETIPRATEGYTLRWSCTLKPATAERRVRRASADLLVQGEQD